MKRNLTKIREEARRLFLTGEMSTSVEIAVRLGVKPHTIGRWRRIEATPAFRSMPGSGHDVEHRVFVYRVT